MVTEAKRKSNNKWDKENMTILACKVRKDYAQQIKQTAADRGTTVNAVLLRALEDFAGGTTTGTVLRVSFDPREDGFSRDQLEAAARASGQSVNAWIIEAIRDKL